MTPQTLETPDQGTRSEAGVASRSNGARATKLVDIVQSEAARGRITPEEAATCEWLRSLWQPEGQVSGSNWADGARVDTSRSADSRQTRALERAATAKRLLQQCTKAIGQRGMTHMRHVLTSGSTLTACAAKFGNGKSGAYERFVENWREDLADLTEWVFVPEALVNRISH